MRRAREPRRYHEAKAEAKAAREKIVVCEEQKVDLARQATNALRRCVLAEDREAALFSRLVGRLPADWFGRSVRHRTDAGWRESAARGPGGHPRVARRAVPPEARADRAGDAAEVRGAEAEGIEGACRGARMREPTAVTILAMSDHRALVDLPAMDTIDHAESTVACQEVPPTMRAMKQRFDGPFRYNHRRFRPQPACRSRSFIVTAPEDRLMRDLRATCDGCGKEWSLDLLAGMAGGDRDAWREASKP